MSLICNQLICHIRRSLVPSAFIRLFCRSLLTHIGLIAMSLLCVRERIRLVHVCELNAIHQITAHVSLHLSLLVCVCVIV